MPSGIKVNQPGFIDFLLAAAAGAATGAERGISARKASQAKQKQQDILNLFTERKLNLSEEDIKATQRFKERQLELSRREGKFSREAALELQELRGEQALEQIEAKQGPTDPFLQQLDIAKKITDIQLGQSLIQQREASEALGQSRLAFDKEKFSAENQMEMNKIQADFAETVFDATTAAEIKRFEVLSREWLQKEDLHPFTEQQLKSVSFWDFMAMTATTNKARQAAVEQSNNARKTLSIFARDLDGLEYKPAKIEFEKTGIRGLRDLPGVGGLFGGTRAVETGEPAVTTPGRGTPPALADPNIQGLGGALESIFGVPFNTPTPTPTPTPESTAVPTPAPVILDQPPPVKQRTQSDVTRAIEAAKAGGRTSLSSAAKDNLEALGYSDAQIKDIERGIEK